MTTKRTEDMTTEELMSEIFGAETMAEIEANEELLARARKEDGIEYSDVSLMGGVEEFSRHRNACRSKRGLPPIA